MTEQEYKKINGYDYKTHIRGDKIRILRGIDKGRMTVIWIKHTTKEGIKGALVGGLFYMLKDIEVVKEDE